MFFMDVWENNILKSLPTSLFQREVNNPPLYQRGEGGIFLKILVLSQSGIYGIEKPLREVKNIMRSLKNPSNP